MQRLSFISRGGRGFLWSADSITPPGRARRCPTLCASLKAAAAAVKLTFFTNPSYTPLVLNTQPGHCTRPLLLGVCAIQHYCDIDSNLHCTYLFDCLLAFS